jgi:hypothetical protein
MSTITRLERESKKMSIIADISAIGTAIFSVGFALWITIQTFKKAD